MGRFKPELLDDEILLNQVREGSREAFNQLYEKYWADTYARAYSRLKDHEQSKDIVQEIFVSIWVNREKHIDNLPAYLNVATRNRVFKLAARQKVTSAFMDLVENIPVFSQQADSNIRWKEFYKSYETLLATLPPKRQLIFRMRYHEDQNTAVIADRMGISRKTVQNQLHKAVEQLRIVLLPCFHLMAVLFL